MTRPSLMAHQQEGVEFARERDLVAFLCDRGTGKTPMCMISLSEKLKAGIIKRILYLGPLSTLENVRREALRFTDNIRPQIIHGVRALRIRRLERPGRCNMDVINYDGVRLVFKELLNAKYDAIVFDESTRVKSHKTRVTQLSTLLAKGAKVKYLLTGMPFTEGVEDAWSQFNILSPDIVGNNYYSFRNRYCVMKAQVLNLWDPKKVDPKTGKRGMRVRRTIHSITGYKRLDDLHAKIKDYTYRAAKEDCLDLPDKTYQRLEIEMLEAQRKAYIRVEALAASEIGGQEISHVVALAKLQKLRQVAAGFVYDKDHEAVNVPTRKYEELKSIVGEFYGKQKGVIFTSFRAEIPMVAEAVEDVKKDVKVFILPREPHLRQGELDKWTKHDGMAVMVCNTRSGGTGLNMTAAHIAIFMSNDWRMEDRAQAEDRIHRIGSEVHGKITIVDLITVDSVEEDILNALQGKRDLVECFLERMRRKK